MNREAPFGKEVEIILLLNVNRKAAVETINVPRGFLWKGLSRKSVGGKLTIRVDL